MLEFEILKLITIIIELIYYYLKTFWKKIRMGQVLSNEKNQEIEICDEELLDEIVPTIELLNVRNIKSFTSISNRKMTKNR